MVIEHALHEVLAIVEIALDGDGVNIGRRRGRHLPLLNRRDLAMREQDEDVGAVATGEGVDGRAARVARRGAGNRRPLAALRQDMIHQAGEKLHRHVLEGQRRPVKEFQHEFVGARLDDRTDGFVAESTIGFTDDAGEGRLVDLAPEKRREQPHCQIGIRETTHGADFGLAELRPFCRHIQPAVPGQPSQQHIAETECGRAAPGAHITHDRSSIVGTWKPATEKPQSNGRIFIAALV